MPDYGLTDRPNPYNEQEPNPLLLPIKELEEQKRRAEAEKREEKKFRSVSQAAAIQTAAELRRIADAAEQRAKLAEAEARSAKEDAMHAKHQSRVSNILAVCAVIVAFLSWIVPQPAIVEFFTSLSNFQ